MGGVCVCSVGFSVGLRWQLLLVYTPISFDAKMLLPPKYQNSFHSMMNLVVLSKLFQFSPVFGGSLPSCLIRFKRVQSTH